MMNQTPTTATPPDNFPRPLRTLVVDDSVLLLKGLGAYLKTLPLLHVVGTAVGGREGLRLAELLQPDLVLIDICMPDLDGFQTTVHLRCRLPGIRIIILTTEDATTAQAKARDHGAHGFISKPRIMKDLMAEIRRVFHWDNPKDEKNQFLIPDRPAFTT